MRIRSLSFRFARHTGLVIALAAVCCSQANAQAVSDHILAGATVVESATCSILRIDFYSRVQLHSSFPQGPGDELRIQLKALDRSPVVAGSAKSAATPEAKKAELAAGMRREQLRAPASERAAVNTIEIENAGIDQTLSIYFRHAVAFKVGPGKDPRSILVAIAGRTANSACEPVLGEPVNVTTTPVPKTSGRSGNDPLELDISEARSALAKNEHDRAIAYLTRVVDAKSDKLMPEALELLGLAREQNGHIAHARADYQSYLQQFPKGDGFTRVQQRLAALNKREQAKEPIAQTVVPILDGTKLDGKHVAAKIDLTSPALGTAHAAQPAPQLALNPWTLQQSGSISTFYNLNQGGRDFFSRPKQQQGWERDSIYQTYRNSALTQGDYEGSAANAFYQARLRISGSQEHRFTDGTDELRISSVSFDGTHKETGANLRLGRQTHFGGGILGRFDGAIATVPVAELWKVRVYGGAPVERSVDRPFMFDRYFYGASVDYAVSKKLDVGAYVIDQKTDNFVDRRAIGLEARFVDDARHGFGSVDYDVHFNEINTALVTGTLNFADKSSVTGTIDYRRSPTMFTSNALQGQIETSVKALLLRYTMHDIEDLARDRTPKSTVGSVAYTRYLRDTLQATAELTITNMSSMPASGGVAQTPSTGWDTYTMFQLMATDVFRTNDSVTGSLRYATTQAANRSLIEGSIRLPMTNEDWRVGPMLRLGYADYKLEPVKEYIIHPMLRTSYNLSRNMLLELEVGKRWTMRDTFQGRANETDFLVLSGMRYDFHTGR
jgi:hypothetical protein